MFRDREKINPINGIAAVSCLSTTAKLVQKIAAKVNPGAPILPQALGVNIIGVIMTAIIADIEASVWNEGAGRL